MEGKLPSEFLFLMILYRLPQILELILPFGVFLGSLLALRQLYLDREIIVMHSGGMSEWRLVRILLMPTLGFALIVALLTLFVSPMAMQKAYQLLTNTNNYLDYSVQTTGKFQVSNNGYNTLYIGEVDRGTGGLREVFLTELRISEASEVEFSALMAKDAELLVSSEMGDRFITFKDGERYSVDYEKQDINVASFSEYQRLTGRSGQNVAKIKSDATPSWKLMQSNDAEELALFQWRIAIPLMMPCAVMIALAMARTRGRDSGNLSIISAILIFVLYIVCLSMVRSAVSQGAFPYEAGFVVVHLVFVSLGLLLLFGVSQLKLGYRALTVGSAKSRL